MQPRRVVAGLAIVLSVLALPVLVLATTSNWNWLRGPLSQHVHDTTGRTLLLQGDLKVHLGWPHTRIHAAGVAFSNPSWAHEKQMFEARNVGFSLAMLPLLGGRIVLDEVQLDRAVALFEKAADGRKNWLLDRQQRDESARITVNHVAIKAGRIGYSDVRQKTAISAIVATRDAPTATVTPLSVTAHGQYRGLTLKVQAQGASVLTLREVKTPYRLKLTGTIGPTTVRADGTITNLAELSAIDLKIGLSGGSLAQLYPLFGIVLPDTPPYATQGRLLHQAQHWRYEKFSGRIGRSDIAGTLQVDTGGKRSKLTATLASRQLNLADLGPLVGSDHSSAASAPGALVVDQPAAARRVLPTTPFRSKRWPQMDADVSFKAASIQHNAALPIDTLSTRLQLKDAVLTLDPLRVGVAGGSLAGSLMLDAREQPIRARADLNARKISLARLFPTFDQNKASIGQLNGDINLRGRGDTVAAMLGSADGKLAMVINDGEISKLMMESVGLHLLEILQLKISGDKPIRIRCGVADFDVKQGVMQSNILVFDTDITRIGGSGSIDLGKEQLDLRLTPKSRKLSLVSLRTPIHVQGSFVDPQVSLDKTALAARGLGALALGLVNPLLALLPLIETGPGRDSECRQMIQEAQTP
ncbi:MAG: AsmA family protein [Thiobacillus sp.]|nr:AsmA family protein [Thiobacillus sp.]